MFLIRLTVALNHEEIKKDPQRMTKIKRFIIRYDWVFQKHILIILIIQKSDIAPLIFINDIVKNINDISEFSRLHFLLCKNTSCLKISYKKFVTPTLKCDIIVLLYIKAAK